MKGKSLQQLHKSVIAQVPLLMYPELVMQWVYHLICLPLATCSDHVLILAR